MRTGSTDNSIQRPSDLIGVGRRPRPRPERLPKGLDAIWHAACGRAWALAPWTRIYMRRAEAVCRLRRAVQGLSAHAFREEIDDLRSTFRRGRDTPAARRYALAVVREVARRELGMEPYPVQIAAALAGLDGNLIEMNTGEGKSLVAATIAAIGAWRGTGVHVLTTNDYLAGRDAGHFERLFAALGLSVGAVIEESEPPARRSAYFADVTYLTHKEAAADFLRDRLACAGRSRDAVIIDHLAGRAGRATSMVQRGLGHAIVDEADSILIDEAVTPLILSGDGGLPGASVEDLQRASWLAEQLEIGRHYRVEHQHRDVELTAAGQERLTELCARMSGLWSWPRSRHEAVVRALSAEHLFRRDEHYVIRDGKVAIVDDATGRLMADRVWRDGLHQAVEVKEGVEVTPAKTTLARISFQRFFRKYQCLTGMTGTAMEARGELWRVYGLPTVRIPPHRPCRRRHEPMRVFGTAAQKRDAVADEVRRVHATGRPVLIGTRSVDETSKLSARLAELGLPHAVLNALHHAREAQIIAGAGQRGAITVATNMAGRGTDIKLGQGVAELGGLHVIATDRHESRRVDRQLAGRAGRQGDPGSAVVLVSLEDELIRRYARRSVRARLCLTAAPRLAFDVAQRKAAAAARRARRDVLQQDEWLADQLAFAGAEA